MNFARDNNLLIAVKGGGHNSAGNAVCDDGIMIDLSLMRRVNVHPKEKTVRVDGGALLGDMDYETQLYGLVVSGMRSRSSHASKGKNDDERNNLLAV